MHNVMNADNNIELQLYVINGTTVAIILQYMYVPNQHVTQLKLTQCHMSNMFQLRKKKIAH